MISKETVNPLFDKLILCLQRHNISYKNIKKGLPNKITIIQLDHKLKSLGVKDAEERLTLCRFIVEPRSDIMIEFNENREISEVDAEKVLKSVIKLYKTYEKEEDEMKGRIKKQVGGFTSTLNDALECEDLDSTGFIQAKTLKGCFDAMDINLDDDLIDYLIFLSGTTEKMGKSNHLWLEYSKISEFVEGLVDDSAYDRKVSDLLKDDNDISDDYGNDFEEPKSEPKKKESFDDNQYAEKIQPQETEPQKIEDEGELDQEITDEEMIGLAENCLVRIAEELLNKKITLRQLFVGEIIEEDLEGEKIELLFPTSFLDGLEKLGIKDFSDLENA